MGSSISRREAVAGAAIGAVAFGAGAESAMAAKASVQGSWRITPQLPVGAPAFVALAAFGAGGVFITTGSDEPGTGIGQWKRKGDSGFVFAYTNFHFDAQGRLESTVNVTAKGTFKGKNLKGTATLTRTDSDGAPVGSPQVSEFTGRRMQAQ